MSMMEYGSAGRYTGPGSTVTVTTQPGTKPPTTLQPQRLPPRSLPPLSAGHGGVDSNEYGHDRAVGRRTAFVSDGVHHQNDREWTSGICDCAKDCRICCCAFWCYPCFTGKMAKDTTEFMCGPCCCGACFKCLTIHLPPIFPNIFLIAMRTKLRAKRGIKGSICSDVCHMWCCEFCASTQMAREMKNINEAVR